MYHRRTCSLLQKPRLSRLLRGGRVRLQASIPSGKEAPEGWESRGGNADSQLAATQNVASSYAVTGSSDRGADQGGGPDDHSIDDESDEDRSHGELSDAVPRHCRYLERR